MQSVHPRSATARPGKRYSEAYRQRVLAHSDERGRYETRILALERLLLTRQNELQAAFRRGYRAGYARQHCELIPWDWDAAEALVRAAEHAQQQDAESWARTYIAKAYATTAADRTDAQTATLAVHKRAQERERRLGGRS